MNLGVRLCGIFVICCCLFQTLEGADEPVVLQAVRTSLQGLETKIALLEQRAIRSYKNLAKLVDRLADYPNDLQQITSNMEDISFPVLTTAFATIIYRYRFHMQRSIENIEYLLSEKHYYHIQKCLLTSHTFTLAKFGQDEFKECSKENVPNVAILFEEFNTLIDKLLEFIISVPKRARRCVFKGKKASDVKNFVPDKSRALFCLDALGSLVGTYGTRTNEHLIVVGAKAVQYVVQIERNIQTCINYKLLPDGEACIVKNDAQLLPQNQDEESAHIQKRSTNDL